MKYLWTAFSVFALFAMVLGNSAVSAQETPTGIAGETELQAALAAVVPDVDDLPVGYSFVGERFLSAEDVASDDVSELTDAGFIAMYVSVYADDGNQTRIRSYASAWSDADAAVAGHDLLGTGADEAEVTSVELGEEPREAVSGTYTSDSDTITMEAVTFRQDAMLLGTAVETGDGSEPDADLAMEIADVMNDRADDVADGAAPRHTDRSLPGRVLPLSAEGTQVQAGFLGPAEVEEIYGTQGSVLSKLTASWIETVALDDEDGGLRTMTIGLTTFDSADDAIAAVERAEDLFPELPDLRDVQDADVDGADSAVAFTYSSSEDEQNALDSYRVIYAVDADLVVIDVQHAPSDNIAAATAHDLATAQLSCQGGDTCELPDLSGMRD